MRMTGQAHGTQAKQREKLRSPTMFHSSFVGILKDRAPVVER
jgi:hypothetical protein